VHELRHASFVLLQSHDDHVLIRAVTAPRLVQLRERGAAQRVSPVRVEEAHCARGGIETHCENEVTTELRRGSSLCPLGRAAT